MNLRESVVALASACDALTDADRTLQAFLAATPGAVPELVICNGPLSVRLAARSAAGEIHHVRDVAAADLPRDFDAATAAFITAQLARLEPPVAAMVEARLRAGGELLVAVRVFPATFELTLFDEGKAHVLRSVTVAETLQ